MEVKPSSPATNQPRIIQDPHYAAITAREREIIALIALGYSNSEIGIILYISHETAKSHVRHALAKLRARTRAELVYRAIQEGVLLVTPSRADWSPRSRRLVKSHAVEWNGSPEELLSSLTKD